MVQSDSGDNERAERKADKKNRLADSLKANLRRRKQQQRARRDAADGKAVSKDCQPSGDT